MLKEGDLTPTTPTFAYTLDIG